MNSIKKADNTNIPSEVLVKGVSHDDFVKLLNELKKIIITEGVADLNNYNKLVEEVKNNDGNEEWTNRFVNQVNESTKVIEKEYDMIEKLFNRIFKDWDAYQKENVSTLETEEKGGTDE